MGPIGAGDWSGCAVELGLSQLLMQVGGGAAEAFFAHQRQQKNKKAF